MENLKIVNVKVTERREILVEASGRDCEKFYEFYKAINDIIYFKIISAFNLGNGSEERIILKYVLPRTSRGYNIADIINTSREFNGMELVPIKDKTLSEALSEKLGLL